MNVDKWNKVTDAVSFLFDDLIKGFGLLKSSRMCSLTISSEFTMIYACQKQFEAVCGEIELQFLCT